MESNTLLEAWRQYQDARSRLQDAKERVLGLFIPRILGLARRYLRDPNQKESVGQSVWASFLANHGDEFDNVEQLGDVWEIFAQITIRHCNKHEKRRQREAKRAPRVAIKQASTGAGGGYEPADPRPEPDIQAEIRDAAKNLMERFEQILAEQEPDPKRRARRLDVLMMRLAGATLTEIAEELKWSAPTIQRVWNENQAVLDRLRAEDEDG
jgi:DNA-directed RNA polymerase specialized sigma24 family protein